MSKPVLAAQLYTIREHTKTAADFARSMKKIRDIGYTAVQVSAIGAISDDDVLRICNDNGLTICITHIGYDRLTGDIDNVIAQHKLWGTKHVAIGSMPNEFRTGEDGYKRFAVIANGIGEKLHAAGLTFSYHNHSFEFVRFGKHSGLELLYGETDARYVQAELDTYWVQHGGADPAAWIRGLKNRMPVIHLKDMVMMNTDNGVQQFMAEVGEGNLNWQAILDACREADVEWYAVEQDICQRDPFESLAISYRNLQARRLR
jgi:sugar phosphate isomerase/epimerase